MIRIASLLGFLVIALAPSAGAQQGRPLIPVEGDPNHWETYFDYGVKFLRANPREAEAAFAWASRLDPTRAEPLFGQYAATFMRLQGAMTSRYLSGDQETLSDPSVRSADSARSMALVRNGFVHRGLEAVMIDRLPGRFSENRDTRAWLAYSNGELPRAVSLYTSSIERQGERARWVLYDRALAYAAMSDSRRALADLRTLLQRVRADEATGPVTFYRSKHFLLHLIGTLELSMRNFDGARNSFLEALVEDASFAYAHVGLAHVARAQQRNAEATEALTFALDLAESDGTIWNFRAITKFSQSQYEAAYADAERASKLLAEWPAPVYLMGQIRERQGRQAESRALYTRFLAMAPASDAQARALRQRLGLGAP